MSHSFAQQYSQFRVSRYSIEGAQQKNFELHCHSNFELIYILQGDGTFVVEGVEYPLHPHALLLMRPYEYHYVRPKPQQLYERIVIHFDADVLPAFLKEHEMLRERYGNYFPLKSVADPMKAAIELLNSIVPLSGGEFSESDEAEAFLHATLTQILLLLTQDAPLKAVSAESDTVLRVIAYLNDHLCEDLSLEELARDFFISKYHLSRIFHQQTGTSIFTYFNTKRMALAQQMLASGESATSVAFKLGFRDYSTFYRAYVKNFGHSPKEEM